MRRGTTPTLTFTVAFDPRTLFHIYVTIKQGNHILEKTEEDCTLTSSTIAVTLTQEETIAFNSDDEVEIQVAIEDSTWNVDRSNIIRTSFDRILKEEVI